MALKFLRRTNHDRERYGERLPPGQKVTEGWPVLTYGSTPRPELGEWRLAVAGAVEEEVAFTWDELNALPQTTVECDIHCVTGWSKMENEWQGVSFPELMRHLQPQADARHVMVHCYGGYTTNLPLAELMHDNVLLANTHNGEPLTPEHGGPLRLMVPHLYFWKSAKWVRGLQFLAEDQPGFWEQYGYHNHGDPWKEERHG